MVDSTTLETVIEFTDPKSRYGVIIDDDGRVAYAYLRDPQRRVVGDVWLYNVAAAPERAEWQDRTCSPPFLNPKHYVREPPLPRIMHKGDVSVQWDDDGGVRATVSVNGQRYAVLAAGVKPGWSAGAAQAGPLAKVLAQA